MHGLINWSIQCFVRDTYGHAVWERTVVQAGLDFTNFEALMTYADDLTVQVIDAACVEIAKPQNAFLEDLGTYLCTHPKLEAVRRLLRFGGDAFPDFLCSLDDLADRAQLALPELEMPQLDLRTTSPGNVAIRCISKYRFFGPVMVGVLRAMADDFGMLVLLEYQGRNETEDLISVEMLQAGFSEGREFTLTKSGAHDGV